MTLLRIAWTSLLGRWLTVGLTILSIALSVTLFLGVEKVRTGARESFAGTISDTDLIVGARSGSVQLLLYSVFRIGNATNNMTWETYEDIAARPGVAWIVPISLGDSHRKFRVMGTTLEYFERYKYRGGRSLALADGALPADLFDAVIGAQVAETLGYAVGDPIVVAHGVQSFTEHDDLPFRISGILERTGTPVDRTVIVTLDAIEAIHVDWRTGARARQTTPAETLRAMELAPEAITAAMIGVESRMQIFSVQRAINQYREEPVMAVIPGVALAELWQIVGLAETALIAVSAMVVVTALIGLAAMIFSSLEERRREMAILRAVGARPRIVLGLLTLEAVLMALIGAALGMVMLYLSLIVLQPVADRAFGLYLPIGPPSPREWAVLGTVVLAAAAVSLAPAWRAYRLSLADGMTVRR